MELEDVVLSERSGHKTTSCDPLLGGPENRIQRQKVSGGARGWGRGWGGCSMGRVQLGKMELSGDDSGAPDATDLYTQSEQNVSFTLGVSPQYK